jgi:hypothetical protein
MRHLTPQTSNGSLLDTMISIRDEGADNIENSDISAIIPGELSDAFARLDPDLAYLHKDMLSALSQLERGKKDGVSIDMLLWRYESAKSAFQTRLIEVRENKLLTQSELSKDEKDEKRVLHELSMQDRMNENFDRIRRQRVQKKKQKEDSQGSWFLYFIIGMMIAQMNRQQQHQNQMDTTLSSKSAFSSSGH